jgi:hypothetical protein
MAGRKLYRATLRTANYRQARQRLVECMSWVTRMNDTIDYVSLFQMNAVQLRTYLADSWPISEERLLARQQYEELLKNMVRRAKAVGCDPGMIEPDLTSLLNLFVRQNVDADAWHRKLENRRHYEQGRTDAEESNALNTLPTSFRSPSVSYLGDGQVAASTAPEDQLLELPLAPVTATQPSVTKHANQPGPGDQILLAVAQPTKSGCEKIKRTSLSLKASRCY